MNCYLFRSHTTQQASRCERKRCVTNHVPALFNAATINGQLICARGVVSQWHCSAETHPLTRPTARRLSGSSLPYTLTAPCLLCPSQGPAHAPRLTAGALSSSSLLGAEQRIPEALLRQECDDLVCVVVGNRKGDEGLKYQPPNRQVPYGLICRGHIGKCSSHERLRTR